MVEEKGNTQGKKSPTETTAEKKIQRVNAAHMQTMEKHSAVIQSMASGLLTVSALTNGAFFAAFVAYLSSPFGQEILRTKAADCRHALLALASGFGLACVLMAAIVHYCNVKFSHYRRLLKGEPSSDTSSFFQAIAIVLITLLVLATIYGAYQVTDLVTGGIPK